MGMAASQARLLSLTSRLHDVELQAQAIEAQKIALATQQDQLYENYCDALNATKFQVAFRSDDGSCKNWQVASFKNLCTYMGDDRYHDYALKDNKSGFLLESREVVENYKMFSGDKYAFAWAMLGYSDTMDSSWTGLGNSESARNYWHTCGELKNGFQLARVEGDGSSIMSAAEWDAYEKLPDGEGKTQLENIYQQIKEANESGDVEKRNEAVNNFRTKLYSNTDFLNSMYKSQEGNDSSKTWNDVAAEFKYWCRKFEAIKQAGGCTMIDPQYEQGSIGETWLKNMVEAGALTIMENDDIKGVTAKWKDTNVATSVNGNFLVEEKDDKDTKKIDAEYEHELGVINRKDKKFDRDLSKLETERSAINKELESIKKVRDENVEKTFGIFS